MLLKQEAQSCSTSFAFRWGSALQGFLHCTLFLLLGLLDVFNHKVEKLLTDFHWSLVDFHFVLKTTPKSFWGKRGNGKTSCKLHNVCKQIISWHDLVNGGQMDFCKDSCGIYLVMHLMPAGIQQKLQHNLLLGNMQEPFFAQSTPHWFMLLYSIQSDTRDTSVIVPTVKNCILLFWPCRVACESM